MFEPEIRDRPSGTLNFIYQFKITDEMRRASIVMPFAHHIGEWSIGYIGYGVAHQEACALQAKALEYLKEHA